MPSVIEVLTRLGGIAPARDLLTRGITEQQLRTAAMRADVLRFRKGWYALRGTSEDVIRASRVGGTLCCASAAAFHRLWVPDVTQLHVSVHATSSRLRDPDERRKRLDLADTAVVIHWTGSPRVPYLQAQPLATTLIEIVECQGLAAGFVVFESALRKGRFDRIAEEQFRSSLPAGMRSFFASADRLSDSGTESLLKLALLKAGISFQQQVMVPAVGPVDFLVGDALVVEIDSKEFHADALRDRRKDAALSIRGFRTHHYLYSQLMYELGEVMDSLLAAIARGDHLIR
jgi:very-short-patch-repair endonuclease